MRWEGSSWLRLLSHDWPSPTELVDCPQPDKEKPSLPETTLVSVSNFSLLDQSPGYSHLQRITAWIFRFATKCHISRELWMKYHLSVKQLTDAEMFWVKFTQLSEFSHEISTLKAGETLTVNWKISKLPSLLDQKGLLQVRGKLNFSNRELSRRNPIILPGKQRWTRVLLRKSIWDFYMLVPYFWQCLGHKSTTSLDYLCYHSWLHNLQMCGRPTLPSALAATSHDRINPRLVFDKVGVDYAGM